MNRIILFVLIGMVAAILAVVLALLGILPGKRPPQPPAATLEFWGFQDDEEVWRGIIVNFRKENPHLTVKYRRLDEATYEETLLNRLAEGRGPDVFLIKNTWVTKHRDKLYPLPQNTFRFFARDFPKVYVDVAAPDLISAEGEILGLPLFVDTLALFYNKDIFNAAGIAEPPKNWDEVLDIARTLTKTAKAGDVIKSGVALGSYRNVAHAFEILSALFLQNGHGIVNRNTNTVDLRDNAWEALAFYTSFADPAKENFSWSGRLPDSLDAFAEGLSAMVVGFADDIPKIRAKNPHLNLGIMPFPQPKDARLPVVYGRYFFPIVSKLSRNPTAAWQFLLAITSKDSAKLYLEKVGRAPARRDLISLGPPRGELETFYRQALIAKSWPVPEENTARRLFQEAIESVLSRAVTPSMALTRFREQLSLALPLK